MIRGITKKNTCSGTGSQLMICSRREIWIATTPKDSKVGIRRLGPVEGIEGCGKSKSLGGVAVDKISGCVERLYPVRGWHASLEKEGADDIVGGTNDALGFAILG
jgi:hypothetical protein